MAVDPIIQKLMDLIEPPDNGDQARPTSDFGARRTTGSNPHGGFDENRGRGVQPHGRVTSPVYGKIKVVDPKLGRIVIEEHDPVSGDPTGYDVEILHTQTQTVKKDDPVKPTQPIGTQGDVGAPGNFHAHIQVYHGDRTPLNPLRHLFEYHHPGEPVPPLPQFKPQQVPPRAQRGPALQSGNQGQAAPPSSNTPLGVAPSQLAPGMPIPGAEGPTSIGGPNGPAPLVPPTRSRAPAQLTPAVDPTLSPLHFAPNAAQNFGPFAVPEPFPSGALGGVNGAGARTNAPISPTSAFGAPAAASPVVPGSVDQIGDGNGIGDWWNGVAPAPSFNIAPSAARSLSSRILDLLPTDPNQSPREAGPAAGIAGGAISFPPVWSPPEELLAPDRSRAVNDLVQPLPYLSGTSSTQNATGGIPGMMAQAGLFDPQNPDQPPAGGLVRLLQEWMRNNPDGGTAP